MRSSPVQQTAGGHSPPYMGVSTLFLLYAESGSVGCTSSAIFWAERVRD